MKDIKGYDIPEHNIIYLGLSLKLLMGLAFYNDAFL